MTSQHASNVEKADVEDIAAHYCQFTARSRPQIGPNWSNAAVAATHACHAPMLPISSQDRRNIKVPHFRRKQRYRSLFPAQEHWSFAYSSTQL